MRYKKATKLAAPEYVEALMNWAQGLLDNEEIFPSEMGACSLALAASPGRALTFFLPLPLVPRLSATGAYSGSSTASSRCSS